MIHRRPRLALHAAIFATLSHIIACSGETAGDGATTTGGAAIGGQTADVTGGQGTGATTANATGGSGNAQGGTMQGQGGASKSNNTAGGSPSSSVTTAKGGSASNGGAVSTGGAVAAGGTTAKASSTAAGGSTNNFWKTVTYSATGLPDVPSGNHNAGRDCLTCHTGTGKAPRWYFAGTVYKANGTTAAPNVQIGINDGTNLYTAYSGTNGNFYLRTAASINWSSAQVRLRNANGEKTMTGATPAASCNNCHTGTTTARITAP